MRFGFVFGVAVATALVGAACENPASTSPTATSSPFAVQFTGQYSGAMQLTAVAGGECVGSDLSALNAAGGMVDEGVVTITQDRSKLTAVVRSSTTGLTCTYQGDAAFSSFALSQTSCDGTEILFRCDSGAARVLELVGATLTGSIRGDTATGTVATSYNVFSQSTEDSQKVPVAGLQLRQEFTAVRR